MFPFDRPKDYNEMLNKIGIFTFIFALGLTWLISKYIPTVASLLQSKPTEVEVFSLHLRILYVAPAVVIALIARVIRLHNCISSLLGIRAHFDLQRILIPLCGAVGIPVDRTLRNRLSANRRATMERTFYAYASFEDPKISKAIVLSAIDLWTWYWILLELIALLSLTEAILVIARVYSIATFVGLGTILGVLIFLTSEEVCGNKADDQIEEIVSDPNRASAIRNDLSKMWTESQNVGIS